jgi:hypothetical protein
MNRIEPNLKTWLVESDSIELFPASEGFCVPRFTKRKECYCSWMQDFLWIWVNYSENPRRYTIGEVELV